MPWISVSSVRHLLLEDLEELFLDEPDLDDLAFDGLRALMVEQTDIVQQIVDVAEPRVANLWSRWLSRLPAMRDLEEAGDMLAVVALCHWVTGNHVEKLGAFAAFEDVKSDEIAALQRATRLAMGQVEAPMAGDWQGHIERREEWWPLVSRMPVDTLFDLALSPDHRSWSTLAYFVLPFALALRRLHEVDDRIFRHGAHPEKRAVLLYDRINPRPDWDAPYSAEDRSTWRGFDAVARSGESLYAYHYLGSSWQVPLLFTDEANVFRFIEQLESSWKLVREDVSDVEWQRIHRDRAAGRVEHVVVYDANVAQVLPDHVERAGEHYGVALHVCDLLSV